MGAEYLTKNDQKCWSPPGFEPGAFQEAKKVWIFCLKLYHWATKALYKLWAENSGKIGKQQPLPNWYGPWLEFDLKSV